jgi:peroxiredoxin
MAVKVGDKAPGFSLFDTQRKPRAFSEFAGKKLVLVFYPGAFTGVCTKEMCAFRDSTVKFNSLSAQVVGVSVDSPFANKAFADHNKLDFPLLSDHSREVSKAYCGLLSDFAGVTGYSAPYRSVFVVDTAGNVSYAWITDNPGNEPNYDEVLKAVEKAQ